VLKRVDQQAGVTEADLDARPRQATQVEGADLVLTGHAEPPDAAGGRWSDNDS
jgi:hypothetical protein